MGSFNARYVTVNGERFLHDIDREMSVETQAYVYPCRDSGLPITDEGKVPFYGHARPWRLVFTESNVSKGGGLSGSRVDGACVLEVWAGDVEVFSCGKLWPSELGPWANVYEKRFRDHVQAMHWFLANEYKLAEHPVDLWSDAARAKVIGTEVLWRDRPGTISDWHNDIVVIKFDEPEMLLDPITRVYEERETVSEDFLSLSIRWGRE